MNTTIKDRHQNVKRLAFCLSNKGKKLATFHAKKQGISPAVYESEAMHNLRFTSTVQGLIAKSYIEVDGKRVTFASIHFAPVGGH